MKPLHGHRVALVAIEPDRALLRYLHSLGAELIGMPASTAELANVSFLVDGVGLPQLKVLGWSRTAIEAVNPRLVHVSVSPFGSHGPLATLQGSELVASAMSGTLRLILWRGIGRAFVATGIDEAAVRGVLALG